MAQQEKLPTYEERLLAEVTAAKERLDKNTNSGDPKGLQINADVTHFLAGVLLSVADHKGFSEELTPDLYG